MLQKDDCKVVPNAYDDYNIKQECLATLHMLCVILSGGFTTQGHHSELYFMVF